MSNKREIFTPSEGPPQSKRPNSEIFAVMGQDNIFRMLQDFYERLEKSEIRHLFPANMREASQKSAAFFVFLLGGPPLYQQQFGPPKMRQRHLPFIIDEKSRQIWLKCFRETLINSDTKYNFPKEHLEEFYQFLDQFSRWMVNTSNE